MCGILGFNWQDEKLAKKLGELIKHRGPDGEGYYSDETITLGHRRLAIIDLSKKGKQPMTNEDKTIWITYNGEIFNFHGIRKELEEKGHHFISNTDTEVIIHGYEEWGSKVLQRLNGQFAFAIYDKKKQQLFLARDRIGINPLYYYWDGKKFIFGSELKVILKSGVSLTINEFAKQHYFLYGYTPRKQSIIEHAYKLEPGHYLLFDLQKKEILAYKRYWKIQFTNEINNEKQAIKLIREHLEKAIAMRLIADVPVGAFLSGGVDSSAVVAIITKYKKNLDTFSVKFDYDDFDESAFGEKVAKLFGTKHHVVKFTAKDVLELLPKLAYHYDEPFADSSMIPTFLVSQVAQQYVTVSLSGDGGDELFGGYNVYKYYRILQAAQHSPQIINNLIYRTFIKKLPIAKMKAFFEIGSLPKEIQYARLMSYLSHEEAKKMINKDPSSIYDYYEIKEKKHYLTHAIKNDLYNYLPEDILVKVDRASMANSLESRPPILDHGIIELAAKIKPSLKLRGNEGKYIFKKTLEGILPKEILYRKKQGFGVPLKYYLLNDLKKEIRKILLKAKEKKDIFIPLFILKKIDQKQLKISNIRIIWSYVMFILWYKEWISR